METNIQYYGNSQFVYQNFCRSRLFKVSQQYKLNNKINLQQHTDVIVLHLSGSLAYQIYQIQKVKLQTIEANILIVVTGNMKYLKNYLKYGATEAFDQESPIEQIENRIQFIIQNPMSKLAKPSGEDILFKIPLWKRVFDIGFAIVALVMLTPLFAIIALFIKLESKGPVFYASKRVGAGYKKFDFYKFRSMYKDADQRVKELIKNNQYQDERSEEKVTEFQSASDSVYLMHDEGVTLESEHLMQKMADDEKAFFKLVNDPRITKIGKFLRNTSIDELPQFVNVLKGDMSIVGNRPLPLYEAEKLTTDDWAQRFLAPAGLTGLWQVNQRAKTNNMSANERKMLDVTYAKHYSFISDLYIIFKTLPAMIQHEDV